MGDGPKEQSPTLFNTSLLCLWFSWLHTTHPLLSHKRINLMMILEFWLQTPSSCTSHHPSSYTNNSFPTLSLFSRRPLISKILLVKHFCLCSQSLFFLLSSYILCFFYLLPFHFPFLGRYFFFFIFIFLLSLLIYGVVSLRGALLSLLSTSLLPSYILCFFTSFSFPFLG